MNGAYDTVPDAAAGTSPATFWLICCILCVYCASRMLTTRPSLIWGKSQGLFGTPLVNVQSVAHRGGRANTTENSIAAIRNAVSVGMQMVEFDVHLTRDKKVVVFHDGDLLRMTGVKGHVNNVNYADLPPLLLPSEVEPTLPGSAEYMEKTHTKSKEKRTAPKSESKKGKDPNCSVSGSKITANFTKKEHARQRIPLLTEVLDELPPSVCMIVEIKATSNTGNTKELVKRTNSILESHKSGHDPAGRIIWFSLNAQTNNKILPECNPDRPRIASASKTTFITLCYWIGVLPFMPTSMITAGAVCCGIVNPSSITIGLMRRVPGFSGVPEWFLEWLRPMLRPLLAPKKMVSHLRKRGISVYMLGVNDAASLALASACGVDAVLTDFPEWLASSAGLEKGAKLQKKVQ